MIIAVSGSIHNDIVITIVVVKLTDLRCLLLVFMISPPFLLVLFY